MTGLLDAIASEVAGHDHGHEDAKETAQAIIALIIARIPPLVWDERNRAGHYRIDPTYGQDKHPYILMCGTKPVWGYDSVEAAKAGAEPHNAAQLLKGMGIE